MWIIARERLLFTLVKYMKIIGGNNNNVKENMNYLLLYKLHLIEIGINLCCQPAWLTDFGQCHGGHSGSSPASARPPGPPLRGAGQPPHSPSPIVSDWQSNFLKISY